MVVSRRLILKILPIPIAIILLFVFLQNISNTKGLASLIKSEHKRAPSAKPRAPRVEKPTYAGIHNATLGVEKLVFINLKKRHDHAEAMTLQSIHSDIVFETMEAVPREQFSAEGPGLGPTSANPPLSEGAAACLMSHANAWRMMLDEGWQSMIVFESDVTWDVNMKAILERFAEATHQLINDRGYQTEPGSTAGPKKNDPWDTNNWDYLALGACFEDVLESDIYKVYSDVDSPDSVYDYGTSHEELVNNRIVRKSGYPLCTHSYAVTRRGAKRLLLRFSTNPDQPADLFIAGMVSSHSLKAYSAFPPIFYQRLYPAEIGERLNSDINLRGSEKQETENHELWQSINSRLNKWQINGMFSFGYKNWIMDHIREDFLRD